MEVGKKKLRGGSEIGSANRVATTAGVNVRSGDGGHESCFCYVAVFDGPSLTDDDSTFLTVEFAPEDGLPLLVTGMKAEWVLMLIQIGSGVIEPDDPEPRRDGVESQSSWAGGGWRINRTRGVMRSSPFDWQVLPAVWIPGATLPGHLNWGQPNTGMAV